MPLPGGDRHTARHPLPAPRRRDSPQGTVRSHLRVSPPGGETARCDARMNRRIACWYPKLNELGETTRPFATLLARFHRGSLSAGSLTARVYKAVAETLVQHSANPRSIVPHDLHMTVREIYKTCCASLAFSTSSHPRPQHVPLTTSLFTIALHASLLYVSLALTLCTSPSPSSNLPLPRPPQISFALLTSSPTRSLALLSLALPLTLGPNPP